MQPFGKQVRKPRSGGPHCAVLSPSDLTDGVVSQVFLGLCCESPQPRLNCGALLGVHFFKQHAHAEDSKASARMHIDHFALQLASARAIGYSETQFRANRNGFERIDITATRT